MFRVDYHWDRLKTCVVGRAYPPEHFSWVADPKIRSALERIMIETEEDFQKLIKLLESFNVKVLRPGLDTNNGFKKPLVAPRDYMAMIGDQFYCDTAGNHLEMIPILDAVTQAGNPIIHDQCINSAIVNRMGDNLYFGIPDRRKLVSASIPKQKKSSFSYSQMEKMIEIIGGQDKVENEIDRIKNVLIDHDCHFVRGTEGHIDGTISLIKPGLLLLANDDELLLDSCLNLWPDWEMVILEKNDRQLWSKFEIARTINGGRWWMPGEENNFALTEFVETYLSEWVGFVAETFFEINTLMIDQNNAVCVNFTDNILDAYSKHNITAHAIDFRHRFFWDGGIHCITADLDRGDQAASALN